MDLEIRTMHLLRQHFWHLTTLALWRLLAGMKHYFLVSITNPASDDPLMRQFWLQFLEIHAPHKKTPAGSQRLAENVWLIERDNGVSYLSSLIYEAEQRKLKHQVLFLTGDDVEA